MVFSSPLIFFPWLSLFLKCSCMPMNLPSYLCFDGSAVRLLSASLWAESISGLRMIPTPPMICPISFVFVLLPFNITLCPSI